MNHWVLVLQDIWFYLKWVPGIGLVFISGMMLATLTECRVQFTLSTLGIGILFIVLAVTT